MRYPQVFCCGNILIEKVIVTGLWDIVLLVCLWQYIKSYFGRFCSLQILLNYIIPADLLWQHALFCYTEVLFHYLYITCTCRTIQILYPIAFIDFFIYIYIISKKGWEILLRFMTKPWFASYLISNLVIQVIFCHKLQQYRCYALTAFSYQHQAK